MLDKTRSIYFNNVLLQTLFHIIGYRGCLHTKKLIATQQKCCLCYTFTSLIIIIYFGAWCEKGVDKVQTFLIPKPTRPTDQKYDKCSFVKTREKCTRCIRKTARGSDRLMEWGWNHPFFSTSLYTATHKTKGVASVFCVHGDEWKWIITSYLMGNVKCFHTARNSTHAIKIIIFLLIPFLLFIIQIKSAAHAFLSFVDTTKRSHKISYTEFCKEVDVSHKYKIRTNYELYAKMNARKWRGLHRCTSRLYDTQSLCTVAELRVKNKINRHYLNKLYSVMNVSLVSCPLYARDKKGMN